MKLNRPALVTATLFAVLPIAGAQAQDLIPRETLFGNPDRAAVRLSPDGKYLSWAAPVEGVLNLWVAPVDDPDQARPITQDTGRGITQYFWSYADDRLLYLQDEGGSENYNLYSVDVATGKTAPLAKDDQVRVEIAGVSEKFPNRVLIGLNDRVPMFHDLYVMDIANGEKSLLLQHPGAIEGNMVAGLVADDDYRIRYALAFTNDGGMIVYENEQAGPSTAPATEAATQPTWSQDRTIAFEDTMSTSLLGFTADGQTLYMADSTDRDTAALYAVDLKSGEQTLLAEDERADVGDILVHPTEKTVQAAAFNYTKNEWQVLDGRIAPDVRRLTELAGEGEWTVTSRTLDDSKWIVATSVSDGPMKYYLYKRSGDGAGGEASYLFSNNQKLADLDLQPMHPTVIETRDGLKMVSYLTLPKGVDTKQVEGLDVPVPVQPAPMVLLVHGGPWARDDFGYNPYHQWLADRGYAVLSVNFRGSTGFGKTHVNAGNRQWGKAMQDDLSDAVHWAVENGIAQKDKVAIMGGSYGGYATLAGLTMTPDLYAAGVDIVGPSNIITLLQTIPPYWAPAMAQFHTRVGNPNTEEGRKLLEEASPLNHVEKIRVPLLIGQGKNDPRVKEAESQQIVDAMKAKDLPVTYVLYPDEGHGFARPENRMSFFGISEVFLAEHLGGQYQPLSEEDFKGSSIAVPEGAGQIPGLQPALEQAKQ